MYETLFWVHFYFIWIRNDLKENLSKNEITRKIVFYVNLHVML